MEKQETRTELQESVSEIYSRILRERAEKAREKELEKQQKKEEKKTETGPNGEKLTKKEKRERELDNWKEIVVGLVGDDLEYSPKRKKRKKYTKWIGDDLDGSVTGTKKPKKPKKRNYQKEFDPELNMLKTMINDQAKFTADLQKRFNLAAGPASKDAMIPNKTLVELAAVINAGRQNSLGLLKEVGGLKKTVADLYLRQQKQDYDLSGAKGGSSEADRDLMLMGSNVMAAMGDMPMMESYSRGPLDTTPQMPPVPINQPTSQPATQPTEMVQSQAYEAYPEVDPSTMWANETVPTVAHENEDKTIYFEKSRSTGACRFVAISNADGRELPGCPTLPTVDPTKIQIKEGSDIVQDSFNTPYPIRYVD